MAMAGGGGARRGRRSSYMADINVTPLVDVMLVLLIVFMVTAPMMIKGVKIDLPRTTAKPMPQKLSPVVISVDRTGRVFLNRVPVDVRGLAVELRRMAGARRGRQVLLKADRRVAYGVVAQVMAACKEAGIADLGMVTRSLERELEGTRARKGRSSKGKGRGGR